MTAMKLVCFVIQGEFITEKARALWEEGEPEKAMEILKCLEGISDGQCIDILEGRNKLIGDSNGDGVEFVEDNAWTRCSPLTEVFRKIKSQRDVALDENEDMIQMLSDDTEIVASPTGARVVPRRKTQRYPEMGGRRALIEGLEFDDVDSDSSARKLRIYRHEDGYGATLIANSSPRVMTDVIEDEPPKPPKAENKITTTTGWLSPIGKFYPCRYAEHRMTAEALMISENDDSWVRICESSGEQHFFGDDDLWTDVQKNLIKERCDELQIERPWYLRDKPLEPTE